MAIIYIKECGLWTHNLLHDFYINIYYLKTYTFYTLYTHLYTFIYHKFSNVVLLTFHFDYYLTSSKCMNLLKAKGPALITGFPKILRYRQIYLHKLDP